MPHPHGAGSASGLRTFRMRTSRIRTAHLRRAPGFDLVRQRLLVHMVKRYSV